MVVMEVEEKVGFGPVGETVCKSGELSREDAPAVWQLAPEYPVLQAVHLHDPVVPPIVPPCMQ